MKKKINNMNSIYVHRTLYSISTSIISIFLPIIIYSYTNSLVYAFLFSVIRLSLSGLLTIFFRKFLTNKLYLSMMLSFIPLILTQLIVAFANFNLLIVIILGILSAITNPLYFIPLNTLFASVDKKSDVSKFEASSLIGKIIYILISGYILSINSSYSLPIVIFSSLIIFILSIIPIIRQKDWINNLKLEKENNILESNKKLRKFSTFFIFFGFATAFINTIFPVYLFYYHLSIEEIAYVMAIAQVLKIVANYISKFFINKNLRIINYAISSIVIIFSSIFIIFNKDPNLLFVLAIFFSASFEFLNSSSFSYYATYIREHGDIKNGIVLRDFYVLSPRSLLFIVAIFIPNFSFIYILSIINAFAIFFTRIDKRIENN